MNLTSSSTSCVWGGWRCSRGPPDAGTSWQVRGGHLLCWYLLLLSSCLLTNPNPMYSLNPNLYPTPSNPTLTLQKKNQNEIWRCGTAVPRSRFSIGGKKKKKNRRSVRSPQDSRPRWRGEWARKRMKIQQGSSSLPREGGGGKLLKWSCSRPQQEIICLIKDLPPSCFLDQSQPFAPEERLRSSGYPRGPGGGSLPPFHSFTGISV